MDRILQGPEKETEGTCGRWERQCREAEQRPRKRSLTAWMKRQAEGPEPGERGLPGP